MEEADLRQVVCTGLQGLINNARSASAQTLEEEDGKDKPMESCEGLKAGMTTLASYAKNFLPCLFNLYNSNITPELRNTALVTIEKYLFITDSEVSLFIS